MGFCIFNNAAIAAAHALKSLKRVLIVDWDVHHGNGTENMFYDSPQVLYFSMHQYPWYPGTGRPDDVGTGRGQRVQRERAAARPHQRRRLPGGLPRGCSCPSRTATSRNRSSSPAGYDPLWGDPLGGMHLTAAGFQAMAYCLAGHSREPGDRGAARGRILG